MSYTKIQTSTKDANTKKALTLGTLAKVNAEKWATIDAKTLEGWQSIVKASIQTFAGLDAVWEKNRETLTKQFKGDRPKAQFAKYYSGYTGSISNMNHFITIAKGKKDADGKYTGKMFTDANVKAFYDAIAKANKSGQAVKYSRLVNLSTWFHSGASVDALTKEKPTPKKVGDSKEDGQTEKPKHGASRVNISVNGVGQLSETTEGDISKKVSKDASMLAVCSDAFAVMFKVMSKESPDAFDTFKAQVVAKCGPLVAEVAE